MGKLVIDGVAGLKSLQGKELGQTPWKEMTYDAIVKFADATGDHQWIHVDKERIAKQSPFGTTIAHGFLTLSLLSFFIKQAIQIPRDVRLSVNYGLNRVRFPSPVRAGAEIRARVTVQSVKNLPDSVEAVFAISVEAKAAAKPCCVAEWIVRYYS